MLLARHKHLELRKAYLLELDAVRRVAAVQLFEAALKHRSSDGHGARFGPPIAMAIVVRKPRMVVSPITHDLQAMQTVYKLTEKPFDERHTIEHELQAMVVFDGEFAEAVAALNAAEADAMRAWLSNQADRLGVTLRTTGPYEYGSPLRKALDGRERSFCLDF